MFIGKQLNADLVQITPSDSLFDDTLLVSDEDSLKYYYPRTDYESRTPVDVRVRSQLGGLSGTTSAAEKEIGEALSMNQSIQAYLEEAIAIISSALDLSENAKDPDVSDTYRSGIDAQANEQLSLLDEFYFDGEYRGIKVLQGGSSGFSAGVDGEMMTVTYGNVNRSVLGVFNVDMTSEAGAESAYDALLVAESNLNGQLDLAKTEEEILTARSQVNQDRLNSEKNVVTGSLSVNDAWDNLETTKTSVYDKLAFAVGIQGHDLSVEFMSEIEKGLQTLSDIVKSAEERVTETQEETEELEQVEYEGENVEVFREEIENRIEMTELDNFENEIGNKLAAWSVYNSGIDQLFDIFETKEEDFSMAVTENELIVKNENLATEARIISSIDLKAKEKLATADSSLTLKISPITKQSKSENADSNFKQSESKE